MPIENGRQVGKSLDQIRDDHLRRYEAAAELATNRCLRLIADVGCGSGYGSFVLATHRDPSPIPIVRAYDRDPNAITFGDTHWRHPNVMREVGDLATLSLPPLDLLVMFEVIEHSELAPEFLSRAPCFTLIGSVPNEDAIPFAQSKHKEHVRHYSPGDLRIMLENTNWVPEKIGSQPGKRGNAANITWGDSTGRTLVFVARRKRI